MSTAKVFLTGVITLAIIAPSLNHASAETLQADTEKTERNYRKTKTGAGALTLKMLEACIQLKAEAEQEYKQINASKEEYDALNNEVSDLAASLQESKEQLDNKDEKAVDAHNEQVELYNQKVEELKAMETSYNEKSEPYQKKADQLEKECNGQSYYEDDYAEAVKKTGKTL
ncbi:MAG: hypothetical protein WGN25_14115 [Candidatus Electrothrix sp. GW3-4]|uniref:hypothetical protein n=1 Tax=Candidatus Electrothrix sp. GW3-4 TaxID=3126740 RepID=UPI0030CC57DB